jgi:hypothetical protein
MVFKSNFVVLAYAKKKIVNSQVYRRIKINIQIIGACKKKLEKTETWLYGQNKECRDRICLLEHSCHIRLSHTVFACKKDLNCSYPVYGAVHVGHLFGFLCPVSGVANVASDSGLSVAIKIYSMTASTYIRKINGV